MQIYINPWIVYLAGTADVIHACAAMLFGISLLISLCSLAEYETEQGRSKSTVQKLFFISAILCLVTMLSPTSTTVKNIVVATTINQAGIPVNAENTASIRQGIEDILDQKK